MRFILNRSLKIDILTKPMVFNIQCIYAQNNHYIMSFIFCPLHFHNHTLLL